MKLKFWDVFYKAFLTAIIFTIFFLVMNSVDIVLEKKGIIGYNKIYILAPFQFFMIIFIYTGVIYLASLFNHRM